MTKRGPDRDPEYLGWAKEQGGYCCLCLQLHGQQTLAEERHHFGLKGMGQKGSDYYIARLCVAHHRKEQGKRRLAYLRMGEWERYAILVEDALALLAQHTAEVL